MPPLPLAEFETRLPQILDTLRQMVEQEGPTDDKAALDGLGRWVAERMTAIGADVRAHPQREAGDHWVGTWGKGPGGVLLLSHLDTVYPVGSLARSPWRVEGDRALGPGVLDMKGGIALALTALTALRESGRLPSRRITFLCTSDEERGSHTSRALLEDLSRDHEVTFCLEPGLPDGSLKTWRKGIGEFQIEVAGRAAHAGANPEAGVNAIAEMGDQLARILALADAAQGTTLNPGVIEGGTYSNVVPAVCRLILDVRVLTEAERRRVDRGLRGLKPIRPGARLSLTGDWNRPPMPRSASIAEAFRKAAEIGGRLGLKLTEGGTGGGSDANFVAALGRPVLDGLGAVGNHAHSEREYIHIPSLPARAALLAACLTEWPADG